MPLRPTLQTIADRVGVSRMTVSNAYSRPDQLSAALRERILSVAAELGYVGPDPAARALARGTTGAIGVLLSESPVYAFSDEVAIGFLGAIAAELAPTGLALTLLSATSTSGVVPARDVAVDGALVYSCDPRSDAVDWLQRRRVPLVYVDQDTVAGIPSVNVDDRGGARLAAQHVLDLRHREVAIVTSGYAGPHGTFTGKLTGTFAHTERERLAGWCDTLRSAGVEPRIIRPTYTSPYDTGRAAGDTLLTLEPRPTAVLCFSDAMAHGVMDALTDAGIAVPDDVSVVGFDDNPISRRTRPALTTVRQDVDAKGRAAASALLKAIETSKADKAPGRPKRVLLGTELVVRQSTAAVSR